MSTPIATEYSTDTIMGMTNQFHAMFGGRFPYEYKPESTLNFKYNCFAPTAATSGYNNVPTGIPSIAYFGVGIRGFYNITADDEISPLSQPYRPKATELDLYRPIPIRCVPEAYDLKADERVKYRLRTKMTIDGKSYVCYWLKVLEFGERINIVKIDSTGAESDYDDSINNAANLTPTPTAPTTPDVITGSSKVVIAAEVTCEITGEEILEAVNVIYHGDLRRAKISEWGIYSGGDALATFPDAAGNNQNYTEALYVQLAAKRCTTGVDLSNSASVQREVLTIQNGNLLLLD